VLKVYCELGAYRRVLRDMERDRQIQLVNFRYEGQTKKIKTQATPSVVTWDSTYVTVDDILRHADIMVASEKFPQILAIIGRNEFDARHLDSAYKSQCDCFLTPDKKDIADNSGALEALLGLEIFHATHQWDEFVAHVRRAAP